MGEEVRERGEEISSWWPAPPWRPPTPPSFDDSDSEPPPINRDNIFPFMLFTFYKFGRHHSQAEFEQLRRQNEEIKIRWLCIWAWMDFTLRELTDIITQGMPYLRRNTKLSFALVYTDERGILRIQKVGRTMCYGERIIDDFKQLRHIRFDIGDYLELDVSIRYPRRVMCEERRAITSFVFPYY